MKIVSEKEYFKKMKELEDLEKEIGLPVLELFNNILGKDIYYLDEHGSIEWCRARGIKLKTINNSIFAFTAIVPYPYDYDIITDSCWTFSLKDLGKTWFLTEEEANKKI